MGGGGADGVPPYVSLALAEAAGDAL